MVDLAPLLILRWQVTQEYLRLMGDPPQEGWHELLSLRAARGPAASLFLLHPRWLADAGRQREIQGARTFPAVRFGTEAECRAVVLWGYPCDWSRNSAMVADHVFPYWAGGPTIGENRLTLCEDHNRMKGADLHLFPWERGEPSWVSDALTRMSPYVRS